MPQWVHDRAAHIRARNPAMPESESWAIATEQAKKLGKLEKRAAPGLMGFKPGGWRAQAGFTPPGMQTAAQRLQKSMHMGAFNADKGLKPLALKVAFTVSQYSGDMNPPSMRYASGAPPFTAPPLKTAGPPSEQPKKEKTAGGAVTPAGRLASSKAVGLPRTTSAPGPSISQISKPKGFGTPLPGTTKVALLERLVRLGATPIPNTPKLLMKVRSPAELKALEQSVTSSWNKGITAPISKKLLPLAEKAPEKLRPAARFVASEVSKDPAGAAFTLLAPGGSTYPVAKRGLEALIDRVAPLS